MKIFIGWSGERSKHIAIALRGWLPRIIQALSPWMSETDLHAGDRWLSQLSHELEETSFGIVVLTGENLAAPWINFESGALAKKIGESAVCPYLVDISDQNEVTGPLAQFQSKRADKSDTLSLLKDINALQGEKRLTESILSETFERWWPDLKNAIEQTPPAQLKPRTRTDRELIEEILERVRSLGRRTASEIALTAADLLIPEGRGWGREFEAKRSTLKEFALLSRLLAQVSDKEEETKKTDSEGGEQKR